MTIRKKLIVSHLCMILIPIFLAFVLGAALFHFWGSRYWDSPGEMLEDLNLSDAAEWTIYECADQYSFGTDFMDDEYERDASLAAYERGDDAIWICLGDQLAGMGYQAQIKFTADALASQKHYDAAFRASARGRANRGGQSGIHRRLSQKG